MVSMNWHIVSNYTSHPPTEIQAIQRDQVYHKSRKVSSPLLEQLYFGCQRFVQYWSDEIEDKIVSLHFTEDQDSLSQGSLVTESFSSLCWVSSLKAALW